MYSHFECMLIIESCVFGEVVLNLQVVRSLSLRRFHTHLISITEKRECLLAISIFLNEASERNVYHKVLPWGKMAVPQS